MSANGIRKLLTVAVWTSVWMGLAAIWRPLVDPIHLANAFTLMLLAWAIGELNKKTER